MRPSLLAIALLALLPGAAVEAATLKGVVLENELSGPPVANVEVAAVAGANPTVSDSLGRFTLSFPKKQPGEAIRVVVQRPGHEVVNEVQLEMPLPADPEARPLTILLCKQGNREEMARRFYRLKSLEAIEETFQRRLKDLEDSQRATEAALSALRRERDQAKAAAQQAADELAKPAPGQASDLYRQAMRLFLDGRTDEAIRLLDEKRLQEVLAKAKKQKAEAERDIEKAVEAWLLKARLLTLQFRFDEAEKAHLAAIDASPESFHANLAYGVFNQELNRHKNALAAYERSLELARRSGTSADIATALNNLGVLHRDENRMDEARKALEEALKIRRELAGKDPETYLAYVATTLNNLGVLHRGQKRMEEAREAFQEALKIHRELARKNPETYLAYVAVTVNNLAILHADQNRMDEARKALEEALKISRELAKKNPETYLADVAMTLNNLGILDLLQDRMEEARKAYLEALEIRRELARKNPETYLPEVATTLHCLGGLHLVQNRMEEARKALEEALGIFQECAKRNPERFSPDVTRTKELLEAWRNLQALRKKADRPKAGPAGPGAREDKAGE